MSCHFLTKKLPIISIFFFSLLFSLYFTSSTYALDDLVFDFSTSASTFQTICADNSSSSDGTICGYKYLLIEASENTQLIFQFDIPPSGSGYYTLGFQYSTFTFYDLTNFSSFWTNFRVRPQQYNNRPFVVTLTNENPFAHCPECEVCQVCPTIPENPYDDKFDQIIRAIYVCAGTLLVLYFFYCIYRLIIKNSGVH